MKKLAIVCLLVVAGAIKGFDKQKLKPKTLQSILNETVLICDKVIDGKYFDNSKTTLLNVGAPHPNELPYSGD